MIGARFLTGVALGFDINPAPGCRLRLQLLIVELFFFTEQDDEDY